MDWDEDKLDRGQYSEVENSEDGGDSDAERNKKETSPTYVEEQRQIQER